MGLTGTDVAKDSSDMILLDDYFGTIVNAVKEGRGIYENIRKFAVYLLSANAMEVLVILVSLSLGMPLPLLPIHLLWINLVTDGLPAIALGVDPIRPNIMHHKPQQFKEPIISSQLLKFLLVISGFAALAILILTTTSGNLIHKQTIAFTAVVLFEIIIIWALRAEYNLSIFSNLYLVLTVAISILLQLIVLYLPIEISGSSLQELFKVTPLNLNEWLLILITGGILALIWKITLPKLNQHKMEL